jgi:predicted site-specific integrase-resolvase
MKVNIGTAAKHFGVSQQTLRRWEKSGKIQVDRTPKGHRRFNLSQFSGLFSKKFDSRKYTLGYARVSSHDQKEDLIRQAQVLENFCAVNGWTHEIVQDLGSGLNFQKRGLKKLIQNICSGKIDRLVLTHKDRLLRFGSELVFSLCEQFGIEVVIMNKSEETRFEDDLVQDVLEIITVFSARLYGARSRKNQKLLQTLKQAAENV